MAERTCSVDGCNKQPHAHGYCGTHYMRWKRTGDPLGMRAPTPIKRSGCAYPGCARRHYGLGWCSLHYQRIRDRGELGGREARISGDDWARYWSKVAQASDSDCWLWTGSQDGKGYGQFRCGKTLWFAHRYMLAVIVGLDLDPDLTLDHLCRTPLCVNPRHLEEVTIGENVRRSHRWHRP